VHQTGAPFLNAWLFLSIRSKGNQLEQDKPKIVERLSLLALCFRV